MRFEQKQKQKQKVGGEKETEAEERESKPTRRSNRAAGKHAQEVRRKRAAAAAPPSAPVDTPETAVAQAGFKDQPGALPYRGELEGQLGLDLSDVQAYSGPNASEANKQLGAEAYALGSNIAFSSPTPNKELVAHEVTHAVQQRHGGGSSEAAVEGEADRVASDLASGADVDGALVGSDGSGLVRKKKLTDKWRNFLADSDWKQTSGRSVEKETETTAAVDGRTATTTKDAKSRSIGTGGVSTSQSTTKETSVDDGVTAAELAAIRADIKDEKAREKARLKLKSEIGEAKSAVTKIRSDARMAKFSGGLEKVGFEIELAGLEGLDQDLVAGKKASLKKKIAASDRRIKQLETEMEWCEILLKGYDASDKRLADKKAADIPGEIKRLGGLTKKFRKVATTTTAKSTSLTITGGFSSVSSKKTVEKHEAGQSEVGSSSKSTAKLEDGVKIGHEETRKTEERDSDGKVVSGKETTASIENHAIAKEDGTVGVGSGAKLKNALSNSHGKVFSEVGAGGAYTVNIVPIPKSDEKAVQQFAVVCSLNLNMSLGVGAEKEVQDRKEEGDKSGRLGEQGKAKGSGNANVSAEASFTHTRTMDAEAAKNYLANLEKAGEGKKPSDSKPEFSMLAKAMEAAKGADDAAAGVAAAFGSGDTASSMAAGESIEFTAKVSGSVGVDASAGNAAGDKSVGGSASAGGSVYRTIKIGRVSGGTGDQKLVEVTVAFGDSSEFAGALSASALGVTASAGKKEWKSAEQSVVFRLDASIDDEYQELYEDIVSTKTPGGLAALRKSPRYGAHVLAYRSKEAAGHRDSLGAASVIGLAGATEHQRASETEVDADGNRTHKEVGSTTQSMSGSIGPLDVWKHSRKDSAAFTAVGNSVALDISEETSSSTATGGEMPSLTDLLSGGAKKALEKALLNNEKTLKGYNLGPSDIDLLVVRARKTGRSDEQAPWFNAEVHFGACTNDDKTAWAKLRRALINAKPAEGFEIEDIAVARHLTRGRAVADFFAEADNPKALLELVLREFEKLGGDAKDAGTKHEWPPELESTKEPYENLRHRVGNLDVELAPHVSNVEDGAAAGSEVCSDVQADLAKVLAKVKKCYTFKDGRAKVEMVDELQGFRKTIVQKRRVFFRAFSDEPITAEDAARDEAADAEIDVKGLESTLSSSKGEEAGLLTSGENNVAKRESAFLSPLKWDAKAEADLKKLRDLYDKHIKLIRKLREAYETAGIEKTYQSCGAHSRDSAGILDIDYYRFDALLKSWAESHDMRLGDYERNASRRKNKYWYY